MKLFALAASLAVALTAAGTASARQPDTTTQQFGGTFVDSFTCGFPLQVTLSVELTHTTFYDPDGTPIRRTTRARAQGTYTGPTGLVAWYDQAMNSQFDLTAGTQTTTGTVVSVTAPGVGMLLHDVGRLILQTSTPPNPPEVIFESGQHPIFEPGAWDPVCAYLAG